MQPMHNLQMMRAEPHKEDQSVNIVLRSGMTTHTNKGKNPDEDRWVRKEPKKEVRSQL